MYKSELFLLFLGVLCFPVLSYAQHQHRPATVDATIEADPQPLLAQAIRLNEALTFLGSSLSKEDQTQIKELQHEPLTSQTTQRIQAILDPYCIAIVNINPEARVKVDKGPAVARLVQNGWTSFLVKVHNEAGVTAQLKAESPNALPALYMTAFPSQPHVAANHLLSAGEVANRFLEVQLYQNRPLLSHLSGLALEYAVVQLYCKDAGKREAQLGFNIGQGTQDIGFRNTIDILFDVQPSVKVVLHVRDEDGGPTMASFIIADGVERIIPDSVKDINRAGIDYRFTSAQLEFQEPWFSSEGYKVPARLTGIYPLPSRRVAAYDEYADFFFQPQVYRSDGEHVLLPPGTYKVTFTRGPEYLVQTNQLLVPEGVTTMDATFQLKRWVNLAKQGWYSADHHIHAAGCSHYESPEEGVKPEDMWRQIVGEALNVGAVLSWGPGWYHQKEFFTGKTHPLSTSKNVMHYDVEVSGFPSSHAGHIVLLNLKEDDYPGTKKIEEWPSWTSPVLHWAKAQGAITGYAHSGWGLQPINEPDLPEGSAVKRDYSLPNYTLPKMDGIGANEYIVTVTQNAVDFYSAGDTPAPWELNMWYQTLNSGFRTRLSGETDYPCIFDERVGMARSYFKPDGPLSYESYIAAIKNGRSYVSEGGSHIIDFSVNGLEVGTNNSEVKLTGKQEVTIKAQATAYLPAKQSEEGARIAGRPLDHQPYWNIERARIGSSRKVPVELIVNGEAVDKAEITADGTWQNLRFTYKVQKSSWVALRVFPSSHTNPIFVLMGDKPIAERKSVQWCRQAVDQCWKMKQSNIRETERTAAEAAYNKARNVYDSILQNAPN